MSRSHIQSQNEDCCCLQDVGLYRTGYLSIKQDKNMSQNLYTGILIYWLLLLFNCPQNKFHL